MTESEIWLQAFADVPELVLPRVHATIVAPHPDDETLGAGGLIAQLRSKGVDISVIAVTDGDNAYEMPESDRIALGNTRAREQREALMELGIHVAAVHRLHMKDSGLAAAESALTDRLLQLVEPGTTLIAPWHGDFHPDHEACGRVAQRVAEAKGLRLIYYFFWMWHRGWPELLRGLSLRKCDLDGQRMRLKQQALYKHRSQLTGTRMDPILPEYLLEPARWPFEVFVTA